MFQQILSTTLLIAGIIYGAVLLWKIYKDRNAMNAERGNLFFLSVMEVIIYIISSVGISDYLQNTLLFKYSRLADDRELPGTLVACGLVPGAIIGFSLLQAGDPLDPAMLISCGLCVAAGSTAGSRLVGKFDNQKIKRIMQIALIVSFVVLIARMILSAGVAGTAVELSLPRLCIAAALCFITGMINMFGIPMKPTWTAMFLVLGLSPITTLTLVLVIAALCPLAGGVNVIRRGVYHRKMAACAVIFGSVGALIGTNLAVSIPASVLNVLLLAVMVIAIITMFKK